MFWFVLRTKAVTSVFGLFSVQTAVDGGGRGPLLSDSQVLPRRGGQAQQAARVHTGTGDSVARWYINTLDSGIDHLQVWILVQAITSLQATTLLPITFSLPPLLSLRIVGSVSSPCYEMKKLKSDVLPARACQETHSRGRKKRRPFKIMCKYLYYIYFIVLMDILSCEIQVAFLEESQLRQSCYPAFNISWSCWWNVYWILPGVVFFHCRGVFNVHTPVAHRTSVFHLIWRIRHWDHYPETKERGEKVASRTRIWTGIRTRYLLPKSSVLTTLPLHLPPKLVCSRLGVAAGFTQGRWIEFPMGKVPSLNSKIYNIWSIEGDQISDWTSHLQNRNSDIESYVFLKFAHFSSLVSMTF